MREKGYIVTASIRHAKQIKCNEIWQITRSDKTILEQYGFLNWLQLEFV